MPNSGGTSRYIIRASDDGPALAAFIAGIASNPALRLVGTIGPQAQPHTVVVETDELTAQQLMESFRPSNQLMIEPDRPLSLFH
jgi:microcystin degradation protein MlrC